MGLIRTALVFGAGYALGHPETRRRLSELVARPEVQRLREQGTDLVGRAGTSVRRVVDSRRTDRDAPRADRLREARDAAAAHALRAAVAELTGR